MLNVASEASATYPATACAKISRGMGPRLAKASATIIQLSRWPQRGTNFDKSWKSSLTSLTNPAFTKEDVDLVKTRLVASLSGDTDEPDTYLQRLQEKVAYAGHPYLNVLREPRNDQHN